MGHALTLMYPFIQTNSESPQSITGYQYNPIMNCNTCLLDTFLENSSVRDAFFVFCFVFFARGGFYTLISYEDYAPHM